MENKMEGNSAFELANKILDTLLESSSSEDEDEISAVLLGRNIQYRVKNFVENIIHLYSDADFKNNLRINRETAEYLIRRYSRACERSYQGGRQQVSAETTIFCFLWFSGNKTTLREVSNLFDMSLSTTHSCINKVLHFLVNKMAPHVIRFPITHGEKEYVTKEFEKISGFPNVLGCVDASYISVRSPKQTNQPCGKRHHTVWIAMQGICDSKLRFLNVYAEVRRKMGNSRIFKFSNISKELPTICCNRYYLLGNGGYPLRKYLLTPYQDNGNLDELEKNYNHKFSETHVTISKAFHALKCRFQQLMRLDFRNVETMSKFVIACCVLHNICIDADDLCEQDTPFSEEINVEPGTSFITQMGQLKRNEVKDLLFSLRN